MNGLGEKRCMVLAGEASLFNQILRQYVDTYTCKTGADPSPPPEAGLTSPGQGE